MSTEIDAATQQATGLLSGFTISDLIMVLAVLLAPLVAIQVEKYLERKRSKTERKLNIFKTLMSTRGRSIDPRHVEALNMIDLEFYDERQVTDSWKSYLDHLNNVPSYPTVEGKSDEEKRSEQAVYDSNMDSWIRQSENQLAELLHTMGISLNYKFDKTHIKRSIYAPKGHADIERDQNFIRRSLVEIFLGRLALPIRTITDAPSEEEVKSRTQEQEEQQQIRELLIQHYKGEAPIYVKIVEEKE